MQTEEKLTGLLRREPSCAGQGGGGGWFLTTAKWTARLLSSAPETVEGKDPDPRGSQDQDSISLCLQGSSYPSLYFTLKAVLNFSVLKTQALSVLNAKNHCKQRTKSSKNSQKTYFNFTSSVWGTEKRMTLHNGNCSEKILDSIPSRVN